MVCWIKVFILRFSLPLGAGARGKGLLLATPAAIFRRRAAEHLLCGRLVYGELLLSAIDSADLYTQRIPERFAVGAHAVTMPAASRRLVLWPPFYRLFRGLPIRLSGRVYRSKFRGMKKMYRDFKSVTTAQ